MVTCQCLACGETWQHEIDCGDRLCPRCNLKRRQRIMHRYLPLVRSMSERKFFTFTVKRALLSRKLVSSLRKNFTKLRHRKIWKASGGIYNIEIGDFRDDGTCNLHIHGVMDSSYMLQKALSDAWRDITGDSFIVDIRAVKDDRSAIHYMTKHLDYMTKHLAKLPEDLPVWKHKLINDVLRGTRLVQAFGDMAHEKLSLREPVCPFCGAVGQIVCPDFDPALWGFSGVIRRSRLASALEVD